MSKNTSNHVYSSARSRTGNLSVTIRLTILTKEFWTKIMGNYYCNVDDDLTRSVWEFPGPTQYGDPSVSMHESAWFHMKFSCRLQT